MATYRIADLLVNMDTWGRTLQQAACFAVEDVAEADINISFDAKKIQPYFPQFSLNDCEYMESGRKFYTQLLRYDGLMLHASAVVMDGKAYLFSAPSGTGKSTHTRLWRRVFGEDRVILLNDDKPAIREQDGCFYAYGTPWNGKSTESCNLRAPIGGICFLKRGEENRITRMSPAQAVFQILEQTVRTKDFQLRQQLLSTLDRLVNQVSVYQLECNMEPEAALLSHSVMSGE